jgi:hypothetical protein
MESDVAAIRLLSFMPSERLFDHRSDRALHRASRLLQATQWQVEFRTIIGSARTKDPHHA